ncbi:MAG: hypothetical protein IJV69_01780 [Kiritimatiellae bacterium]|nr:hypothetical protein [Kiritimatiellia bacterium]
MSTGTPFHFSIETPSGIFIEGDDITSVEITTDVGKLGIMARHEPIVAACPPGLMRICQGGEWITFRTSRAILVGDGTTVKLLTPLARLAVG